MSGISPLRFIEPLALTERGLSTGSFGLSSDSRRTPAVTVRFGRTNHWSCRKRAVSFWPKSARPGSAGGEPPDAPARVPGRLRPDEPLGREEGGGLLLAEVGAAGLGGGHAAQAAELPGLAPAAGQQGGLVVEAGGGGPGAAQ